MSPGLVAPTGIGLLLGLRHAFEPDHLAAVSTLATRQGRLGDACRLGLAWALGHTASLGAVALLIIAGGLHPPARLAPAPDLPRLPPPIGLGGMGDWRHGGRAGDLTLSRPRCGAHLP